MFSPGQSQIRHPKFRLYETKMLSDCSILVGREKKEFVTGHKAILSAASPILHDMFIATEGVTKFIINDIEPEIFISMLKFIYTDSLDVNCDSVYDVVAVAKNYQMPYVMKACFQYIGDNLSIKNVLQAYSLALCSSESDVLKKKCEEFINKDTIAVLNNASFLKTNLDVVVAVFSLDSLNIENELVLWYAADRYADYRSKRGETLAVYKILQKIRFLSLTIKDFLKGLADTTVLPASEACAILINMTEDKSKVSMPSGYSKEIQGRNPRKESEIGIKQTKNDLAIVPSEIKFKLRVPNIEDFTKIKNACYKSSMFQLQNLKWCAEAKIGTILADSKKYLQLYVHRCKNESNKTSCNAEIEFLLLRNFDYLEPSRYKFTKVFEQNQSWGINRFIAVSDLLNPNNHYITDGTITVQIHIKTDKPLEPSVFANNVIAFRE
ncbi:hypothetical protein ABMA28_000733 [Loxostege sticticalis]|uniref:BTB domain-containing protein n=1 Tax=Loxostege sticticalis TaxID=481309 RepID=A0ABD0T3Q1_LOXSC